MKVVPLQLAQPPQLAQELNSGPRWVMVFRRRTLF